MHVSSILLLKKGVERNIYVDYLSLLDSDNVLLLLFSFAIVFAHNVLAI